MPHGSSPFLYRYESKNFARSQPYTARNSFSGAFGWRMNQIPMDFTPGLLEQFPEFMDCVRASVNGCGRQLKAVAADMDMSSTELNRRLVDNPADWRFPVALLPKLIQATGDTRPAQWLALKFMADPATAEQRALRDLAALAPMFNALANVAGLTKARR